MKFHEKLSYDKETGIIVWTEGRFNGCEAGTLLDGYMRIKFEGKNYRNHRVAWFMIHGEWPNGELDHINGDRADNRICNLREATKFQNQGNRKRNSNSKSGIKGVIWNKRLQKWEVQIQCENKPRYLGLFHDIEEAAAVYAKAAKEHFGEFARLL